ncbi:MAG: ABC transporter permease subunit [Candidatus Eiseniibacteriota bacterium]|jgi:sodium transport system permease protein
MRDVWIVWRKEMLDTMRDSRTVFLTLALPLVLYPVIFVIIGRVQQANQAHQDEATLQVAVRGLEQAPRLEAPLRALERVRVVPVTIGPEIVKDGTVQVFLDVPEHHEALVLDGAASTIEVYFDATSNLSRLAMQHVEPALAEYRLAIVRARMAGSGIEPEVVDAPRYEPVNLATAREMGALAASSLVPYLLVLLIASGAQHTAIDTTAGEKERSTLETMLVSAASRTQIILGKFLATGTTAVMSGLMGFLGLALATRVPASGWAPATGELEIGTGAVLVMLAMILPVAALLSAVFLALGCFARGAREGQTFASYFIIFVIMLAVLSTLLEVELDAEIFLVPIVGTTLAQRQLLTGAGDPGNMLIAVAATLAVAAAALAIAVRLFASERVMFRQ